MRSERAIYFSNIAAACGHGLRQHCLEDDFDELLEGRLRVKLKPASGVPEDVSRRSDVAARYPLLE
jgi:hypothetical protein